jgi:cAMP phosphodiesterase
MLHNFHTMWWQKLCASYNIMINQNCVPKSFLSCRVPQLQLYASSILHLNQTGKEVNSNCWIWKLDNKI